MATLDYLNNWQRKKIAESNEFQSKAFDEVNNLVIESRDKRKLKLADGRLLTDFISCSYLGLDMDERVINAATNHLNSCGVTFPAARTRAKVKSFILLEELLGEIFCHSSITIFNSLHMVHLGILPLLGSGEMPSFPINENGPLFILEKSVHASIQIQRALLEQFGEVVIASLDQANNIEEKLKEANRAKQTPIIITDSIGSMSGIAPIKALYALMEKYSGYLYVDDAHGTSILGKNGCGYTLKLFTNQFPPRLILTSSLSKGFGCVGGIVALPTRDDNHMVQQYAQTYIFSGPPPLSIIESSIASAKIHLSDEIQHLQEKLWDNVRYFDKKFENHLLNFAMPSPLRGYFIGDELKAIYYAKELQKLGYAVTTSMYPTVPKNKSILRIALSSMHEHKDIDNLYNAIIQINNNITLKPEKILTE